FFFANWRPNIFFATEIYLKAALQYNQENTIPVFQTGIRLGFLAIPQRAIIYYNPRFSIQGYMDDQLDGWVSADLDLGILLLLADD
ncbi:MAG: hypothetical protein PF447_08010, partial [Spirochaetaceae bacterium]|nr:hypothetical protein [Spirochaetaceae bacterium]